MVAFVAIMVMMVVVMMVVAMMVVVTSVVMLLVSFCLCGPPQTTNVREQLAPLLQLAPLSPSAQSSDSW